MTSAAALPENAPVQADIKTVRRAVIASAMGNATEWFDYSIFTSAAVVGAIGANMFPGGGTNDVLKSLAVLAVGFIFRPLGGAFFGPLGDKLGRQRVLSLTIILMSGCTFLVGVLPTYASVGILSPILLLLLRVIQGFSTGGEYGGAATFIAEYAPTKRRGFWGSFLEFGTLAGYVLGQVVSLICVLSLSPEQLQSWGWRIPFFIALPLGLVGLYLRNKLEDTPTFKALDKAGEKAEKAPLKEIFQKHWRMILNLFGIVMLLNVADYLLLTYFPSFLSEHVGISDSESGYIIIAVELVQMAIIAPIGALSDRIGRKPILLTAAIGFVVLSYPLLLLVTSGTVIGIVIGFGVLALLLVLMLATIGSTFPAMFPTRVRYGSFAIGYNLSTSIFAGTAPVLVEAVIKATNSTQIPAYYLMIVGLIAIVPIILIPETAKVPIEQINTGGDVPKRKSKAAA